MRESKRGIKLIGKSSFLYYLTPDIIYHIDIEEEKNGIQILFVKMKCDKTWIYQHVFKYDEMKSIINPLKRNNNLSNKEIINDISLLIYNNNFTFNEIFDKILVKLIFDKSNQTSFYLQLIVEDKDSLENKSKQELLYEIERLNNIINVQKDKLEKFEKKQDELNSKILKLESTNNQIITYLKNQKKSQEKNNNTIKNNNIIQNNHNINNTNNNNINNMNNHNINNTNNNNINNMNNHNINNTNINNMNNPNINTNNNNINNMNNHNINNTNNKINNINNNYLNNKFKNINNNNEQSDFMEGMRMTMPEGSKRPNIFDINNQNLNIQNFNNPFKNSNNERDRMSIPFLQSNPNNIKSNNNNSSNKNPPLINDKFPFNQYKQNPINNIQSNPYEITEEKYEDLFKNSNNIKINITERITLEQSSIVKTAKETSLIHTWINPKVKNLEFSQIYKGTKYNFSAEIFHKLCDNNSPTLILIECDNGARSGGYTTKNWSGDGQYKSDTNAFLFSLDYQKKYSINSDETSKAIYCRSNLLCAFGNGYDLAILDQSKKFQSISNFPITYGGYGNKVGYLTGGFQQFYLKEIEVYLVLYSS